MARLNEPPIAPAPSAETIDAVKRRFLRQNRELAKTNSQQSIRIRTLENDASRLLAENLSLREQVLQLQNTLEAHSNRPSFENIDSVKDRLEAKIQELGGLVAELGQLKKKDDGLPRCKSQLAATRRSPDERQWRSGLGLQEVENAMMPTIVEDKYYPRRTMNADELREILDEPDSQSPDIGPPPVSRFENEEAIAFNPNSHSEESPEDLVEGSEPALPITLETRRKRRESGPKLNIRRVSVFESPPDGSEEGATRTVRAGAKRKFSVQEDEEKSRPQAEPFRFSRRNTPAPPESTDQSEDTRPKSPERPVLGSKPVNTDPVLSPKKQRSSTTDKAEKKPLPKNSRSRLTITRNVQTQLSPLEMPEPIPTAEIHLDSLPPKTPAVEDIFSPHSTEPSTARPDSKDTPPPGDLNLGDQNGNRPSRRARAQVSYKEPSLNTKMRRPGKELVDAVPDPSRRTSVDPQVAPSTCGRITIKEEPDESSWKPIGAVVVRRGGEDGELGSPLCQKLDRREGSQDAKSDAPKLNSEAASHAISAMIEETSAARRKSANFSAISTSDKTSSESTSSDLPLSNRHTKPPPIKQETSDLAIFDFNESSPPAVPTTTSSRPRIDLAKAARSARRHSSVPNSTITEERRAGVASKTDGASSNLHKRTGSGGVRSASTSNLVKSTTASRPAGTERKVVKAGLPSSASKSDLDLKSKLDSAGVGAGSGSGSLRASRRKSMML